MTLKYPLWATLNDEGRKEFGAIFPSGQIPIKNPFSQLATIEETRQTLSVYDVNWYLLTTEEKNAVLEKLSKKFGAPKELIKKDIEKIGLPLRAIYVDSVGVDPRFLI